MTHTFKTLAPLLMLAPLALAACGTSDAPTTAEAPAAPSATTLGVENATVRLNANASAPSAAYFAIVGGPAADVLVGVTSPDAGRVELHESRMDGGMMTMAALSEVPVPAGGRVEFRSGGKHVMLFDIAPAARAADTVRLTLSFRSGATLTTDATATRTPAAAASATAPAPTAAPRRPTVSSAPATAASPAPAAAPAANPQSQHATGHDATDHDAMEHEGH